MPGAKSASKPSKSAKHAEFLAGLTAEGLRPVVNPSLTKNIAEALENVGDALPPQRLATVLDLVMAYQSGAIFQAVARKPVPMLERLLAPLFAARARDNDFQATFFLAALAAGVLQPAAALAQVLGRIVNMPGLIKQAPKVTTIPEVLAVARQVLARYLHDTADLCQPFQLVYGLIGVLAKDGEPDSIDAIRTFTRRASATYQSAERQTWRMVEAVGQGRLAADLKSDLSAKESERRQATASQAIAEKLQLPMRADKDWSASIWIAVGAPTEWFGLLQETPQIHLRMCPATVPDWNVELRDQTAKRIYDCRGGELLRNDFDLPRIATLDRFPGWLIDAGKKLQVVFTPHDAKVNCGRQRSAGDLIRAWLAGGA